MAWMRAHVVVVLFLAACGGKIASGSDVGDESEQTPAKTSVPGPVTTQPSTGIGASSDREASVSLPETTLVASGTCAVRNYTGDTISSAGAPRCQVKNRVEYPGGRVEIEMVDGDAGVAKLANGNLFLTCGTNGRLLFQAVIDCYAFDGDYTIAAGALVLGDQVSDRKCRLGVDDDGTNVSGFISCDDTGASELFSSTTAPIGLGAFALPRR